MLTIYGVYRSRASRNLWLAHELDLPFRHVPVIQSYRLPDPAAADAPLNTASADFLAINPNGLVPTLDDDGLVLHESLAINLHLARKYGNALGPRDQNEDGLIGMWSLWAATGVEPHSIQILYNMASKPAAERDPALATAAIEALRGKFAVLDQALAGSGFLVGGRFTVADINVSEVVRYAMPASELFDAAPNVRTWIQTLHARPGFKKMAAERDREPA